MKILIRNVFLVGLLLLTTSLAAQIPQELIDKAKAAGMSETQLRQEIAKRKRLLDTDQETQVASDAVVTDRSVAETDISAEEQRLEHLPENDLKETIFGREIFSGQNLSFPVPEAL